LCQWIFH